MATPITVKEAESSIWDMFVEACEEEGVDPHALGKALVESLEEAQRVKVSFENYGRCQSIRIEQIG